MAEQRNINPPPPSYGSNFIALEMDGTCYALHARTWKEMNRPLRPSHFLPMTCHGKNGTTAHVMLAADASKGRHIWMVYQSSPDEDAPVNVRALRLMFEGESFRAFGSQPYSTTSDFRKYIPTGRVVLYQRNADPSTSVTEFVPYFVDQFAHDINNPRLFVPINARDRCILKEWRREAQKHTPSPPRTPEWTRLRDLMANQELQSKVLARVEAAQINEKKTEGGEEGRVHKQMPHREFMTRSLMMLFYLITGHTAWTGSILAVSLTPGQDVQTKRGYLQARKTRFLR